MFTLSFANMHHFCIHVAKSKKIWSSIWVDIRYVSSSWYSFLFVSFASLQFGLNSSNVFPIILFWENQELVSPWTQHCWTISMGCGSVFSCMSASNSISVCCCLWVLPLFRLFSSILSGWYVLFLWNPNSKSLRVVSNFVKREWYDRQTERAAIRFWTVTLLSFSESASEVTLATQSWMVRNRDKCPLVTRWRIFDALCRRTRSCRCFRCASAFLSRSRLLLPPVRLLVPERLTSRRLDLKLPSNIDNGSINKECEMMSVSVL